MTSTISPTAHNRCAYVIPALDASDTLGPVLQALQLAAGPNTPTDSTIVVDDGSQDNTADIARRAGASVIRHETNLGKGQALRSGLVAAGRRGYAAAVSLDADGQHPAHEAVRLAQWGNDDQLSTTLLLGIRDLKEVGAPRANRFSNKISNFFLSKFAGGVLHDTQCGLRRYPIQATLSLHADAPGYGWEAQVILRARQRGITIEQIPVDVRYGPGVGRSHFHVVRDPARIIVAVLKTLSLR